jgi:amino acid adenylation domain-containing protein
MSHAKDDISALRSGLSETKRALLEKRLRGKASSASEKERIPKRTDYGPAALSFAQQRLWFLDQLDPGKPFYNNSVGLRMRGNLNVEALKKSFDGIIARHEILRTTFSTINAEPVQVVSAPSETTIEFKDLSHLPEQPRELEAMRLTDIEAHRPFDLSTGLLLRVSLLKLDQQEYVLLLNMHHIISDGWSKGILVQEFAEFYEAYVNERRPALPELGIQYADYAVWQRNWLQGESLRSQLAYWKDQLHDAAPVLDLPTDRPRPALQSHLGAYHSFFIPEDITRALKALSQKQGCTLFMTLLALFDSLLFRYSGQNDILVGTPIANRNRVDIERLIGFFVNTLVMRGRVERGDSFLTLLEQQREVALGAYANQDLPFEKLVEEVQPERSLSHTPLFQVLLVLQNAPVEELRLPGLRVKSLDRQTRTSAFDMTMSLIEKAEGLNCSVEYNADLFDVASIVRLGGHFSRLAEAVAADAGTRVIDLEMLSQEERRQLLYEFNRTDREYPRRASIHEIFQHQAERLREKVAISERGRQLTYGELNRSANRVASYLKERGVGVETFVGLCMERSIEMVIAMLGVLKAGGAYVPLDPTYPKQRLEFMLEDAKPSVIICQEHLMEVLPAEKEGIKGFKEMWEEASRYEGEEVGMEVNSQCLAYVMYTSGSTGKPKGVSIPHRAVVWLVNSLDEVRANETSIVGHGSNTAFDAATFEIWTALLLGGQVEVISKRTLIDAVALKEYVEERRIEVLYLTAALFAQVASQEPSAFRSLGCVLYGGEAVDPRWAGEVLKAGGPDRLLHLMGTTETTVFSSWHVVKEVREDAKRLSMGAAMPNVKYYVLDEEMEPAAMGVAGELYLGGEGVGRGYLNRPDLTAERFIPNPYSEEPGRRMYATGDVLRMDEMGEIEFVRRKDQQVKIRGFRVELGEIEGEVRKQEGVRECVVVADEGEQTGKRLVCYVVEKQRGVVNKEEMMGRLRKTLPEYMVPAIYEIIEEIPLTANGKVDKAKLPRVEAGHRSSQEDLVGPRDNIELQLIQIWEKILGARYIAVTDNFFDLGGHSLSALRLKYEIQTTFKYELSLNSLFQSPTTEHIAQLIRSSESALRSSPLIALRSGGSRPPFYCVHPGGGSVLGYLDLARCLGSDQPFYGLQSPGLEGEGEVYTCIEDMAARYIQEICALQPEGPYFFGGWSLGGVVAFEMARQFKGLGKQVALLALIDSYAPANDHDLSRLENDSEIIGMFLRDFRGRIGKEMTESYDDLNGKDIDWLLQYLLSEAKSLGVLPPDAGLEDIRRLLNVFKANMHALKSYRPKAYSDRITLFRAETSSRNLLADNTSGWEDLTDNPIEVHLIPGSHYTMVLRPNVQILAEKLGLCLDREQKLYSNNSKSLRSF